MLANSVNLDDISFVCDEPTCELAMGAYGLTAADIVARVQARRAATPDAPAGEDPTEVDPDADVDPEDPGGDVDPESPDPSDVVDPVAPSDDPADPPGVEPSVDPLGIDPTGEGAPCPLCAEASPPRSGKLLAVPTAGPYARALSAAAGWHGLLAWQVIQSGGKGTARLLDALATIADRGEAPTKKAGAVVGGKVITVVVIRALPFDGHLLRFRNRDPLVLFRAPNPDPDPKPDPAAEPDPEPVVEDDADEAGKKKKRKKKPAKKKKKRGEFESVSPRYGLDQGPPGPSARENPIYVRELQEDLLYLGYFTRSRGSPPVGVFMSHLVGSVLAFKHDLMEIYGIEVTDTRQEVVPGSIEAGRFNAPIHYQKVFLPPNQIVANWHSALAGNTGVVAKLRSFNTKLGELATTKTDAAFTKALAPLETVLAQLEWWVDNWPHRAVFEDVTAPFVPFAPRKPALLVDDLQIPEGAEPKHKTAKQLNDDPIWSSALWATRPRNVVAHESRRTSLFEWLASLRKVGNDATGTSAKVTPPPGAEVDWLGISVRVSVLLARLDRLHDLTRFWVLDLPRQIEAWLDHLVEMSTVDQPTAVYLKALREGGRIGPHNRPAYQLFVDPPDLASPDAGATFIRKTCTDRPRNVEGKKARTMPEVLALQFIFNEGGGKFADAVKPYNTRPGDKRRLPLMGIDTNTPRRGTFDAICHRGGNWYLCRGWGMGQATESEVVIDGIQLIRGLPIMKPGATAVVHPRSFTEPTGSLVAAIDGKAIAKYNTTARIDCTYGTIEYGHYYDCQSCLKRFYDQGLAGTGKYGKGGVIVPRGKGTFGTEAGGISFFVDLERYTKFARAGGAVEDPSAVSDYLKLFGRDVKPAPDHVAQALRLGPNVDTASATVAKALGLDAKQVAADVEAHIAARSELPCSWMKTRIRYAGAGEQAIESLQDLLKVVGDGQGKPIEAKHITEASELRRNA